MACRSRLLLATLVLTLAFAGCHCPPRRREAPDASPIAFRGKAFVLGHEHAVNDAVWLPNGHLLGASENELYDLTPDSGSIRHVPLEHHAIGLYGSAGGKHFVIAEGTAAGDAPENLAIYDASTLRVTNRQAHRDVMGIQGDLAVLSTCAVLPCKNQLFDLSRGDPLFSFETPGSKDASPNIVEFSPDGRWLAVYGIGRTHVFDTTTGKKVLERAARRTSEGGWRQDLFALRNDRLLLSSVQGFEAIDLPSAKVRATMPDPFAGEGMVDFVVDREARHVSIYAPRIATMVVWSPDEKPALGPKTKVAEAAWEPENAMQTAHFARVEHPKCRIVETATKRVVFEHAALCGSNAVIHAKPGFRPDEKYFGVLYEGSLQALELGAFAQLAGMGELPAVRPASLDSLVIDEGVPKVQRKPNPFWLTRRPPPPLEPPPPAGATTRVVKTATHRWVCTQKKDARTVVAFERASGKEVLNESIEAFDTEIQASDDIAFIRVKGGELLRCQPGHGCKPVQLHGYIGSFDNPWVALGQRQGDTEPSRLFNLVTNEMRPFPAKCGDTFGATVFRDGPTVLCSGGPKKPSLLWNADGSFTAIALPESAPHNTTLVGRVGSFLYFAGVVNAGLTPGYRYDIRTREVDRIHLGSDSAIVEFADGKIERFGSAASTQSLRCLDGDALLPWMECRAAYEVEGRFDGEPRD